MGKSQLKDCTNDKLIIVGSLPDFNRGIQFGGATVLTQNLIDYLKANSIPFEFIQNNKYYWTGTNKLCQPLNMLYSFCRIVCACLTNDKIMFNYSDHGVCAVYPIMVHIAKLLKCKVILRKFGGELDIYLSRYTRWSQNKILRAIKKSDLIFLETKKAISLLDKMLNHTIPIAWFPNNRVKPNFRKDKSDYNKKLVFISHINSNKGVDEIIDVSNRLKNYSIELYGAIKDDKYRDFDFSKYGIKYYGEISTKEVPQILSQSSLLLLPSNYREGFPGIVIEALSVGLPVIVSNVGGISEIVSDWSVGRLIQPKNSEELFNAITSITPEIFSKMSENAFEMYNKYFNSEIVNKDVINKIYSL